MIINNTQQNNTVELKKTPRQNWNIDHWEGINFPKKQKQVEKFIEGKSATHENMRLQKNKHWSHTHHAKPIRDQHAWWHRPPRCFRQTKGECRGNARVHVTAWRRGRLAMTSSVSCCKAASRRLEVMKLSVTKKASTLAAWRDGDRGKSGGCGYTVPVPAACLVPSALPCALDWLLQPVLLDSATSLCCCTFSSNFCVVMVEHLCSNPWWNNFVEGKIWDHPSKNYPRMT